MDGRLKLLMVEDDIGVRERLAHLLEREYEILEAGTVAEALPLIGVADVMLLDLILPNGTGVDVLKHVARERDDLPVLFSTSWPEKARAVAPLVECLPPKPYTLDELREGLQRCVSTWDAVEKLKAVAAAL